MEIEQIRAVMEEVLDERLKAFYIDREVHYQDHQFIKGFRVWTDNVRFTVWKTIVGLFAAAIISLLLAGFIVWGKNHFK